MSIVIGERTSARTQASPSNQAVNACKLIVWIVGAVLPWATISLA